MRKIDEEKLAQKDKGVIMALLDRFNNQRLPRARSMQKKVDSGELLDDRDLEFIREVQNDSRKMTGLIERHPQYKELAAKAMHMWSEIIEKDAENRKTNK